MKKLISSIILLTMCNSLHASYSTDWIKPADTYLKQGTMIARDKSDNVIVTGYIQAQNIYTRKYDKFGNLIWEKTSSSGIASNYEKPSWVNCDKNKNVYVVGYRYSWGSSWEYPNAVVILKYNSGGTLLWKRNVSLSYVVGSSTGLRFNLKSELDNNGNLYIGTAGTSPSGFVFIKLNPSGVVLVNITKNLSTIHGFASMRLKGNKVIVLGTASYNQNSAIVAWDTAGTYLWSNILTSFSGRDVEIDGSGNSYLLTSYPNQVSATSGLDVVIYKFNPSGTLLWKKKYDFGGEELATRFTLVSNKLSVIASGSVSGAYLDWITFQINTAGTKLWDVRYNGTTGNDEQPYFISAKANGEVFVTGKGGPLFTQPNGSSYLRMVTLKYGNTGTLQWLDTLNIYSGWGIACTLASDSSLFVLSDSYMTAFHFLDHTGTGSCGIPAALNATNITDTSAIVSWSPITGAYLYHLRYKTTPATTWTEFSTNATSLNVKGLTGGTSYNYSVEAICSSGPSGYIASQTFTTIGVGYCTSGGVSASQDALGLVWIGSIQIGYSGANGYYDFTNLSTNLTKGSTQTGYVSGGGLNEFFRVWIDYNHNNSFNDAGELVWEIGSSSGGWQTVSFVVPSNAMTGATRMRVSMKRDSTLLSCGSYPLGQTEDFMVNIVTPLARMINELNTEEEIFMVNVYPNPVKINSLLHINSNTDFQITPFVISDITGKIIEKGNCSNDVVKLNDQIIPGTYFLEFIIKGRRIHKKILVTE